MIREFTLMYVVHKLIED